MSEHATETETTPPAPPTAATTPPERTTTPAEPTTFTEEDIKRLVGKAREEGKRVALEEVQRKRADDEAKAKGEWEKVATDREAEIAQLKREKAELERRGLVAKVAARHRLPESLAGRLLGETEDEIEADAKAIAKELGARAAPETEAGAGTNGTSRKTGDRPAPKAATGPVYAWDGSPKVPWPAPNPTPQRPGG